MEGTSYILFIVFSISFYMVDPHIWPIWYFSFFFQMYLLFFIDELLLIWYLNRHIQQRTHMLWKPPDKSRSLRIHYPEVALSGRRDGQKDLPLRESRLYALKETFWISSS